MKRTILLCFCVLLILTACKPTDPQSVTVPPVVFPATQATEPFDTANYIAVSVPAVTEYTYLDDGTEIFSYTYQHMELTLSNADIANIVILDFLNRVDQTRLDADNILRSAQNDFLASTADVPYFFNLLYSPTRVDSGVLSLFGTQTSYSGGMHGGLSCVSANYDLTIGAPITLGSIMAPDATKNDYINLIISKLEALKDKYYLYDDYESAVRERLGGDENRYEDFYFTNTGLCFFFSPYEIAPYSSGIISVELPYCELPGLIYDGYFPPERESTQGVLHTGSFMETDMEQFTNMAEVNLAAGEDVLVVYPEGSVTNISIELAGNENVQLTYTVFAAYEMTEKNAIILSLPKRMTDQITIYYNSGNQTEEIALHS